ncbi:MAG: ribonuclease III [Candidatus Taylorbacteria bacterium]|nr:ribonuclease III [Candidatus Taylorbacteria bacterium]
MTVDFSQFESKAGVEFKDKSLIKQAFTHRSFINENRKSGLSHNERLEFLGDAVLELAATDFLYKKYPTKNEGDLTSYRAALVNANSLGRAATELGVNDFLLLSKGEAKDVGRARAIILADTMEAIIGAIYLDQGYISAKKFIEKNLFEFMDIEEIIRKRLWMDSKSHFQEKAQEKTGITPSYRTVKEIGPDHDKRFSVGVFLGDVQVAIGEGASKQEAEQVAAEKGLIEKGWL